MNLPAPSMKGHGAMPATPSTETTPATGATTTEPTTAPTTPPATTPPATTPPADESALGDAGKRALDAERTARKAAETAAAASAAKVQEYEDAAKSDSEKLTSRAERAESSAQEAHRRLAAIEAGLPASMADRLKGSTPEELAADAAELKATLAPAPGTEPTEPPATPPPGSLDGGARTPAPTKSLDDLLAEASAAGDDKQVHRLNAMKLAQLSLGR